ncbi:hypothetical protein E1301_Tti019018 [Triplophysa tibetana]|uniref:Uncharacterized protein n=1 Tax=Triplophysa tibetana TaxID=1572043 RepID=A0A5A9MZX6_9TELE|nr:hypothetical protein E1301_Tti019018 [Triplophysa tibetana]
MSAFLGHLFPGLEGSSVIPPCNQLCGKELPTDKTDHFYHQADQKQADQKQADKKQADKKQADKKQADKKQADKKQADKMNRITGELEYVPPAQNTDPRCALRHLGPLFTPRDLFRRDHLDRLDFASGSRLLPAERSSRKSEGLLFGF